MTLTLTLTYEGLEERLEKDLQQDAVDGDDHEEVAEAARVGAPRYKLGGGGVEQRREHAEEGEGDADQHLVRVRVRVRVRVTVRVTVRVRVRVAQRVACGASESRSLLAPERRRHRTADTVFGVGLGLG